MPRLAMHWCTLGTPFQRIADGDGECDQREIRRKGLDPRAKQWRAKQSRLGVGDPSADDIISILPAAGIRV